MKTLITLVILLLAPAALAATPKPATPSQLGPTVIQGGLRVAALRVPNNLPFTTCRGSLTADTYYYRVTAKNLIGETTPSTETSLEILDTGGVLVKWGAVPGAQSYRVYGRVTDDEELLIEVSAENLSYCDSGALTPSGAMPETNTTDFVVGGSSAATFTGTADSGNNAFAVTTEGARVDFGPGDYDHCYGDAGGFGIVCAGSLQIGENSLYLGGDNQIYGQTAGDGSITITASSGQLNLTGATGLVLNGSTAVKKFNRITTTDPNPGGNGVAANTCENVQLEFGSAAANQECTVSVPAGWNVALAPFCYVSGDAQVELVFCNPTAGVLTPTVGTYSIRLIQ